LDECNAIDYSCDTRKELEYGVDTDFIRLATVANSHISIRLWEKIVTPINERCES